jgi:hypothetical protein
MKQLLQFSSILLLVMMVLQVNAQQITLTIQETHLDGTVSISFDDGEFENDSIDKLDDDDLDMGWEGDDLNIMTTFTRFRDVNIPQGATILSAVMTLYAHEDEVDEAIISVFGEASDSSISFTETESLADRNYTTANVPWVVSEQWTMWQPYTSPDLSSVIQEIVNRPNWKSGNPFTLYFQGQDQGASFLDQARDFESYENIEDPDDGGDGLHHPERIPVLVISYSTSIGVTEAQAFTMNLYPNPAINETLEIQFPHAVNGILSLHAISGKEIMSTSVNANSIILNLSDLAQGVYFIKLTEGVMHYTKKFILK